jgi:hypothetical protein
MAAMENPLSLMTGASSPFYNNITTNPHRVPKKLHICNYPIKPRVKPKLGY